MKSEGNWRSQGSRKSQGSQVGGDPRRFKVLFPVLIAMSALLLIVLPVIIIFARMQQPSLQDKAIGSVSGRGYWYTGGNQIFDSDNKVVRIAGINWFGFETGLFAPGGLDSRDYRDLLELISSLGYNTVRLPYSSQILDGSTLPENISFAPTDKWLDGMNKPLQGFNSIEVMDEVIRYGGSIGLRFILDRHRPDSSGQSALWYTDNYSEQRWIDDWKMLAARYKGNTAVIGADLHNEPHTIAGNPAASACWGCGDYSRDWRLAAERAGNAILSVNPDLLVIVEGVDCWGPGGRAEGSNVSCHWWGGNLKGVRDYPVRLDVANRLVYSAHEYSNDVSPQSWSNGLDYPDNLPKIWDEYWGFVYRENRAPLLVGEFGTLMNDEKDHQWLDALVKYASEGSNSGQSAAGMSWAYWSLNPESADTGGILQDDWATVNTAKQRYLEPMLFPLAR